MHRFRPGSLAVRPHPGQIAILGGRAAPWDVWFFKGLEWVLRSRLSRRPAASGPLRGLQSPRENPSALYPSSCEYVSLRSGRNEAHTASGQCCTPALGNNSLFGGLPGGSDGQESACNAGDQASSSGKFQYCNSKNELSLRRQSAESFYLHSLTHSSQLE